MNWHKRFFQTAALAMAVLALPAGAHASEYSFTTTAPQDYYKSSSYEDVYGSAYNYGGRNVIDYQAPDLEYGVLSSTMTGIMERTILPGLQGAVATNDGISGGYYGVASGSGGPLTVLEEAPSSGASSSGTDSSAAASTSGSFQQTITSREPAYTSIQGMEREDGSIGTVQIPTLNISMKVWEGETNESMKKGMAHYSSTSAWDGNVGLCGHNRGNKYAIGAIKNLEIGDVITYTTVHGTRTYTVSMVKTISNSDWSYLQATRDNRITLTTCLADHPEKRICVQAVEKTG